MMKSFVNGLVVERERERATLYSTGEFVYETISVV